MAAKYPGGQAHIEQYAARGREAFERGELVQVWFIYHIPSQAVGKNAPWPSASLQPSEQQAAVVTEGRKRKNPLTSPAQHERFVLTLTVLRYMGGLDGKRVQFPRGRATVIGDESQQDESLAGQPLGRRWRLG